MRAHFNCFIDYTYEKYYNFFDKATYGGVDINFRIKHLLAEM